MIPARHAPWFQWLFDVYLKIAFWRSFHAIEVVGEVKDKGLGILVIANHISWWDGFWILHLNQKIFKRKLFVMMLEEQLRKNSFLRKLGAFSIRKKSKTAGESLTYAAEKLKDPRNMVLLFPQGEIHSHYAFPLQFEQGWGKIVLQPHNEFQVLMVANLLDYFSSPKPLLRQYIYSPEKTSGITCSELQEEYNRFYQRCIQMQTQ